MSQSNFTECTSDFEREHDGERWIRRIDNNCWISALHRMTGFGYMEWETALMFVLSRDSEGKVTLGSKNIDCLIIAGDRREELNDMPKEKLREWYQANITGNRNSMETILEGLREAIKEQP